MVNEREVIPASRASGKIWQDAMESVHKIAGVECTKEGSSVVPCGNERPEGGLGRFPEQCSEGRAVKQ